MSAGLIDTACEREEQNRADALAYRKPELHLNPMGFCHWCESEVRADEVFCPGSECKDSFRHRLKRRQDSGKL